MKFSDCGPVFLDALSEHRWAGMLSTWKPKRWESGLAGSGYSYFGLVFDRFLESRGYNQSTFADECRRRGFRVGRLGNQRAIGQRSISDWMRGHVACPREVPTYADAILDFSEEEWAEFGLAYAYGQMVPAEEFEELLEFRKFYRAELSEKKELQKE